MAPQFDLEHEHEFAAQFAQVPCPALDPATGHCDLYVHRPITCRTFGPPVRFADDIRRAAACASPEPRHPRSNAAT